jgi:GntR family transcriptional repressor for pyruvate dehydrogenase complex
LTVEQVIGLSDDMPSASALPRPPRLTDHLVRELERRIGGGAFAGGRLPTEKQLCLEYRVSRAVVREAVARLQADGYVETRQGAGAFVAARPGLRSFRLPDDGGLDRSALQHVLELRLAVEVAAAGLAARRRRPRDLGAMREALAAMAEAVRARRDGAQADDRFHAAVAAATHNPQLTRLVEFLRFQFWRTRRPTWSARGHAGGQPAIAQREHEQLYAAIAAGDARAARAAARGHLLSSGARLGLADPEAGPAPRVPGRARPTALPRAGRSAVPAAGARVPVAPGGGPAARAARAGRARPGRAPARARRPSLATPREGA